MSKTLSDKNLDAILPKFFALDVKLTKELEHLNKKHLKAINEFINEHNLKKIIKEDYELSKQDVIEEHHCYAHELLKEVDVYKNVLRMLHAIRELDGNDEIRNMYEHLYA